MTETPSLWDDDPAGLPPTGTWEDVAAQAAGCRNCPLWEDATQTVFGEGPVPAILRAGDRRQAEMEAFTSDLAAARRLLAPGG